MKIPARAVESLVYEPGLARWGLLLSCNPLGLPPCGGLVTTGQSTAPEVSVLAQYRTRLTSTAGKLFGCWYHSTASRAAQGLDNCAQTYLRVGLQSLGHRARDFAADRRLLPLDGLQAPPARGAALVALTGLVARGRFWAVPHAELGARITRRLESVPMAVCVGLAFEREVGLGGDSV